MWSRLAGSVPGGWVEATSGLSCIATGSSSPWFNLALSPGALRDPQAALDAAHDRFGGAGLRWLLKLQPDLDREPVVHARRRGVELDAEPVYVLPIRPWAATAALTPSMPTRARSAGSSGPTY